MINYGHQNAPPSVSLCIWTGNIVGIPETGACMKHYPYYLSTFIVCHRNTDILDSLSCIKVSKISSPICVFTSLSLIHKFVSYFHEKIKDKY